MRHELTGNAVSVAGDDRSSGDVLAHSVLVLIILAEILLLGSSYRADERDARLVGHVDLCKGLSDAFHELVFEDGLDGSFAGTSSVDDDAFWLDAVVLVDELADELLEGGLERVFVDNTKTRVLMVNVVHKASSTLGRGRNKTHKRWVSRLWLRVGNAHSHDHQRSGRWWERNINSPVFAAEFDVELSFLKYLFLIY